METICIKGEILEKYENNINLFSAELAQRKARLKRVKLIKDLMTQEPHCMRSA